MEKPEYITKTVRVLNEIVATAEKEADRLGGSTTPSDLVRHWLRLGMKADPKPTALLP